MRKAVVLIVQNESNDVLLLKRNADHVFPNQWCFPGGKFLGWKDGEDAAHHEVLDETGVKMKVFFDTTHRLADDHYLIHVFACLRRISDNEETAVFPNREHTEYGFFPLDSLPEGFSELSKEYLEAVGG